VREASLGRDHRQGVLFGTTRQPLWQPL
jgi:hypothetical protein